MTLRSDRRAIAAVTSVLLAAVSAFFFLSHVILFIFPIMPIGAWLGWQGRLDPKLRAVGWVGFILCAALAAYLLFILVIALIGSTPLD